MEKKKVIHNVRIEDARITFRNFSGAEGKFNAKGNRNFGIFLPDDVARSMEADGWSIKWLNAREDEAPQALINVKVTFGNYPPNIYLISDGVKSALTEANVNVLDYAEIATADIEIRPYSWDVSGKTGVKAYLKTAYIVLVVDEFAKKYSTPNELSLEGGDVLTGDVPF